MITAIVTITLVVLLLGSLIAFYRAEGLMAFFILGSSIVFIVVETLNVWWSTVMTGPIQPVCFVPCVIWWWMMGHRDGDLVLPRRLGRGALIILLLFVFWETKHFFEHQYLGVQSRYEYFKWAYLINRWGLAFLLGFFMPLSVRRLRRLLGAMGYLSLVLGGFLLINYLSGQRSLQGVRYTVSQRAGGLTIGIDTAVGGSALLAYLVLGNEIHKSQLRMILVSIAVGIIAVASLLTASRGPMVALAFTVLATVILTGGRNAVRLAVGLAVLGVIVYLGLDLLTPEARHRLFGTLIGRGGTETRWRLFVLSFNMLSVAPMLGQTIGLEPIIGIDYSHQIVTQVMVELGLTGLAMFLIVTIPMLIRWGKAGLKRQTAVRLFAAPLCVWLAFELAQRNIAGQLACADFWMLIGILTGHALRPHVVGAEAVAEYLPPEQADLLAAPAYGPYLPEGA